MKKYDVVALGELLIDFTENGTSAQGNPIYEASPGGAPCNVLSMLTRLGRKTAFIGKVGQDIFGKQLKAALNEVGIDTCNLMVDEEARTTLAFVETFSDGDRDFSFYRNPGADMMLRAEEVNIELVKNTEIFHFGTLSMTHKEVRNATKQAVAAAKEAGAVVSFDPNLREQYDIPLIMLSAGKEGSRAYYKDMRVEVKPFLQENTIETTGAGDTFGACCLHHMLKYGLQNMREENLRQMLTFANAAASIITTRKGALRVMPGEGEVRELMGKR